MSMLHIVGLFHSSYHYLNGNLLKIKVPHDPHIQLS